MPREYTRYSVQRSFEHLTAKLPLKPNQRWYLEKNGNRLQWRITLITENGYSSPFGERYRNAEEFVSTVNFYLEVDWYKNKSA